MSQSVMRTETLEIPNVITHQLMQNHQILTALTPKIRQFAPDFVLTVARGSSDHAATFAKYLCEIELGLITSSAAPSVYTLYRAPVRLSKSLVLALSQSGQSPDICEVMNSARQQGALNIAFVNIIDSPLAELADYLIPLHAGPEKAVAATKSYVATLSALLHLVALYKEDDLLLHALKELPTQLEALEALDFSELFPLYATAENALVIGRGFGFPIAEEVALKFKEVTQIHAEAFSSAEVLHGPFSLFHESFPVMILLQKDASLASVQELIAKIKQTPVKPVLIGSASTLLGNEDLPHIRLPETHPLTTSILTIFVLYQFIEQLAIRKGLNPDHPPLIQKVTKTL